MAAIVGGDNRFAADLYQQLRHTPGNVVFSPYSASASLAMVFAGARNQTASEMMKVLHFPFEEGKLHAGFRTLQAGVKQRAAEDSVEIAVNNRLWGQEGYQFLPGFIDIMHSDYGADLRER